MRNLNLSMPTHLTEALRTNLTGAASTLRQLGFQRVVALDGGMKAWREAGYPIVND